MDEIKIIMDGKYYAGQDLDKEVEADYGGRGWHVSNHYLINPLVFTDDPDKAKVVIGKTSIRSTITMLMDRIKLGEIKPKEIRIIFNE